VNSVFWIVDCRLQIVDCGLWIADSGFRIPDSGFHLLVLPYNKKCMKVTYKIIANIIVKIIVYD